MKKSDVVKSIFHFSRSKGDAQQHTPPINRLAKPQREKGMAFAPTNIALCKYWGKRDIELNLPITSSLSIALPNKGAMTTLTPHAAAKDLIILNGKEISFDTNFAKRLIEFLDIFRLEKQWQLHINIDVNIPVAAGLASSACGFASLVAALNDLFAWELSQRELSILARLGSGSAARSFWNGFVEWHAGVQPDGMDSYAEPLEFEWPGLCIGLLSINETEKPISSREAMQRTVNSSLLYGNWPKKVNQDMAILKQALQVKNFALLSGTAESNALTMHATMLASWPPICYFLPATIAAMQKVWDLRREGLELYFTQDAGPNLKLIFLEKNQSEVQRHFPQMETINVFE